MQVRTLSTGTAARQPKGDQNTDKRLIDRAVVLAFSALGSCLFYPIPSRDYISPQLSTENQIVSQLSPSQLFIKHCRGWRSCELVPGLSINYFNPGDFPGPLASHFLWLSAKCRLLF
ncbi:hypothetical protein AFLA_000839 [Aspergillus flavus NRRL3357]|nr:hypothetical protein AFLA_000839 [Aspergillus flavus NRRL3357]